MLNKYLTYSGTQSDYVHGNPDNTGYSGQHDLLYLRYLLSVCWTAHPRCL